MPAGSIYLADGSVVTYCVLSSSAVRLIVCKDGVTLVLYFSKFDWPKFFEFITLLSGYVSPIS